MFPVKVRPLISWLSSRMCERQNLCGVYVSPCCCCCLVSCRYRDFVMGFNSSAWVLFVSIDCCVVRDMLGLPFPDRLPDVVGEFLVLLWTRLWVDSCQRLCRLGSKFAALLVYLCCLPLQAAADALAMATNIYKDRCCTSRWRKRMKSKALQRPRLY